MADDRWRDAQAYAYQYDLTLEGLAWEFLRRNEAYQAEVAEALARGAEHALRTAVNWGLSVAVDPSLTALQQSIFWRPTLDPRTLRVTAALSEDAATVVFNPALWPGATEIKAADDGWHLLLRDGAAEHRLWLRRPLPQGAPLAIIQPIDAQMPIRTEAARRFVACLSHATPKRRSPDTKTILQRLIMTLRAFDGRKSGASQRRIAEALLREVVTGPRAWEDSAARATTARLLRRGAAMVGRDYRQLLLRAGWF